MKCRFKKRLLGSYFIGDFTRAQHLPTPSLPVEFCHAELSEPCENHLLLNDCFLHTTIKQNKNKACKPEYFTPEKNEGYYSTNNCLSDYINTVNNFCPPNKMDDSYFNSSQDVLAMSKDKLRTTQSFSVQDVSKLALILAEQDSGCCRESGQNSLLVQRNQEENMTEQRSHPFQRISELNTQTPDFKREVTRSHVEQRGAEVGIKKTLLQSDYPTNNFFSFGQQQPFSTNFFPPTLHPSKEGSQMGRNAAQTSVNLFQHTQSNHYQSQTKIPNKTSGNIESQGLAKLMSLPGFVPLLSSQQFLRAAVRVPINFSQGNGVNLQGRIGLVSLEGLRNGAGSVDNGDFDLQQENNRHSAGLMMDGRLIQRFSTKPKLPAGFLKELDKTPGLLQNPYQALDSMYGGQVRHGGAASNSAKPTPSQIFPFLCQMGDPRTNACNSLHSQPHLPYSSVPHIETNELLPNEFIGPNQASGDGAFSGFKSAMSLPQGLGSPNSQLHHYLEECYKQWRMLERERKKAEAVLIKNYPGKRVSVVTSVLPIMPSNPSRVDRLIVDQMREQAKMASLLGKMEQLQSFPLHANICSSLDRNLEVIYITQTRRKNEFINANSRQRQPVAFFREDMEILLLASALQMTLPKTSSYPEERQEEGTCFPLGQDSPEQISLERALAAL
ncbi:meiosis-specific coiled-coil domain-containing protein MEIOC-like isoform X2 [Myxocyprinus asiaticus]|uniref:meiosis-specific coiled-coil domain-containing protein MEIOC-like isoform X2 n=1 Tax=Myxocyprinus asiaticus TaxID=70543 RepID=UPI002222FBA8|nr:meiosis-specific coiled-coil domain-containing protein MEIOC-like isoform X2 [Myxocyprinus asiaticus]